MTKKGQRVHTSPPISFNVILRENESKCSSWWFSINQCCEHVNNYRGLKPDGMSSICFKESFTCNKVSCLSRSSEAFDPALACRLQCPKLICNLDSIIGLLSLIRAQLSPSLKTNVKTFWGALKRHLGKREEGKTKEVCWEGLRAVERSPVSHKCSTLIRVIHFIIRLFVLALSNMQHADSTEEDKKGML